MIPDELERKKTTEKKSSLSCHNPLDPRTSITKLCIDYGRDADSMDIKEFIFGDSLYVKIFFCFFCRSF